MIKVGGCVCVCVCVIFCMLDAQKKIEIDGVKVVGRARTKSTWLSCVCVLWRNAQRIV